MFATVAVNPITSSVAVLEFKRSDGAILKLDSTHRLVSISPDGEQESTHGLISEADDFLDIVGTFLTSRVKPSPVAVQNADVLAGYEGSGEVSEPGDTYGEILANADNTDIGYSEANPA